jgi:tRNA U38,U39,U40 pseudouridine synthase TruA
VRIFTGTLLDVAAGKREPEDVAAMLAACDRRVAGPTAPPQGLCLVEVLYPGFSSRSGASVSEYNHQFAEPRRALRSK